MTGGLVVFFDNLYRTENNAAFLETLHVRLRKPSVRVGGDLDIGVKVSSSNNGNCTMTETTASKVRRMQDEAERKKGDGFMVLGIDDTGQREIRSKRTNITYFVHPKTLPSSVKNGDTVYLVACQAGTMNYAFNPPSRKMTQPAVASASA